MKSALRRRWLASLVPVTLVLSACGGPHAVLEAENDPAFAQDEALVSEHLEARSRFASIEFVPVENVSRERRPYPESVLRAAYIERMILALETLGPDGVLDDSGGDTFEELGELARAIARYETRSIASVSASFADVLSTVIGNMALSYPHGTGLILIALIDMGAVEVLDGTVTLIEETTGSWAVQIVNAAGEGVIIDIGANWQWQHDLRSALSRAQASVSKWPVVSFLALVHREAFSIPYRQEFDNYTDMIGAARWGES